MHTLALHSSFMQDIYCYNVIIIIINIIIIITIIIVIISQVQNLRQYKFNSDCNRLCDREV